MLALRLLCREQAVVAWTLTGLEGWLVMELMGDLSLLVHEPHSNHQMEDFVLRADE